MGIRSFATALSAILMTGLLAAPAASDRLFTRAGGLEAYISDDFTCSERVRMTLVAANRDAFRDGSAVEKIVGGIRAALGFQCDRVKDVLLAGKVGSEIVFGAIASDKTGWSIVEVPLDLVAEAGARPAGQAALPPPAVPAPAMKTETTATSDITALALPPAQPSSDSRPAVAVIPPTVPPAASQPALAPPAGLERFREVKSNVETGSFPVGGYKFSGMMTALFLGRVDDVPDDQDMRGYVVSVLSMFNQNCGEAPSRVSLAAVRYASPQMREIERDPVQGLGNMLMDFAKMRDSAFETGNYMGAMADYVDKNAILRSEGIADARVFIGRHGCQGPEYDKVSGTVHRLILDRSGRDPARADRIRTVRLMSPEHRALNNIPDPEIELAAIRARDLHDQGKKACTAQFQTEGFCGCAVEGLKQAKVSDDVWQTIGRTFTDVAAYPNLRGVIAKCY
jgi:hypothetical protein